MEETFKFGPFSVKVNSREFSIVRDSSGVTFHPVSSENAINLISHAMRIENFATLPSKLVNSPYTLFFDKDRTLRLKESFQSGDGIPFSFSEGDTLIFALRAGLDKWLDVEKASRSGTPIPPSADTHNPPFDVGH